MVLGRQFAPAQPRERLELQDFQGQLDERLLGYGVWLLLMVIMLYEYGSCVASSIGAEVHVPCIWGMDRI